MFVVSEGINEASDIDTASFKQALTTCTKTGARDCAEARTTAGVYTTSITEGSVL